MPDEIRPPGTSENSEDRDRALTLTLALDQIRDSVDEDEDPHKMFDAVVRLLRDHFSADACAVVLLTETTMDEVEAIASVGLPQGAALDLCRAAMFRQTPGIIDNPYVAYAIGNQITLKDMPLGGLILARAGSPFSDREIALLEIAERQIDSAILQARTMGKLVQRNRELEAIYQADNLRDSIDSERALLRGFVKLIAEFFSAETTLIFTSDSQQFIDSRGLTHAALHEIRESAERISIPQVIASPHGYTEMVLLAAPFIIAGERIGAVVVGRADLFTVADHRLLYALTSQIDSAIHDLRDKIANTLETAAVPATGVVENESIRYRDGQLMIDDVAAAEIAEVAGTPVYVYSLKRVLSRLHVIQSAFEPVRAEVHFSAKANGNLAVLRTLISAGAGVDCVSGGEIFRAMRAGAAAEKIVFAGVGKTVPELEYAVQHRVGWINVENVGEIDRIQAIAERLNHTVRIALRFNPDIRAQTHRHIATGHGGAKFGLSEETIREVLDRTDSYPHVRFEGIHIHIGSQLAQPEESVEAVKRVRDLIEAYPHITTINVGGGFPVAYHPAQSLPSIADFAAVLNPLLAGYHVILEPGRSIVADAGVLLTRVEYVKHAAGDDAESFVITDAGMTELIRPALYEAYHGIRPVHDTGAAPEQLWTVAGPVCETTDVLGRDVRLPEVQPGDMLAIFTAGAYGMVMASNYNARLRPAEVVVDPEGTGWRVVRRRETFTDLVAQEEGE